MQSNIQSKQLASKKMGGQVSGYKARPFSKPLHKRNMYLDLAPFVLRAVFERSSKSQLVYHGKQIKTLLLPVPSLVNANKRKALFELLRYCKKLYYAP